jgi:hypothetical protein
MLDLEEIKKKIKSWLEEEGVKVSEAANPSYDFKIVLENAFGLDLVIEITKPKNKLFLVNGVKLHITPEIQKGFSSLNTIKKFEFLEHLKRELLGQSVDFNLSSTMDELVIVHFVYLEDLSRTIFMNSIKSVRNSATISISTLLEKFSLSNNPTPHRSHSDLISPYG